MKKYLVTYYGWIPGYNDFDQDDFIVEANSLQEATEKANKSPNLRFAKYEPYIKEYESGN